MKKTGGTLAGTNSAWKSNIQVAYRGNKVSTLVGCCVLVFFKEYFRRMVWGFFAFTGVERAVIYIWKALEKLCIMKMGKSSPEGTAGIKRLGGSRKVFIWRGDNVSITVHGINVMIMVRSKNNHNSGYKPTAGGNSPVSVLAYSVCITYTCTSSTYRCIHIHFSGYAVGLITAGNSDSGLDKENFTPNCI